LKLTEKLYRELGVKKGKWKKLSDKEIANTKEAGKDLTDELFDMIQKTYASIGGHVSYKKPSDLPGGADKWTAIDIDDDPEPDVVNFFKTRSGGTKSVGSATDGSKLAKKYLIDSKVSDLAKKGYYAEVSDAIAHVLITRHKVAFVDNEKDVIKALGGKKIEWVGLNPNGKYPEYNGWYNRVLPDGKKHLKIMVGKPKI